MNAEQRIHYQGWDIVPFAAPTPDGKWAANCEIEKIDAQGLESFQGVLDAFVSDRKDAAISVACEDARRHIDAINADPVR